MGLHPAAAAIGRIPDDVHGPAVGMELVPALGDRVPDDDGGVVPLRAVFDGVVRAGEDQAGDGDPVESGPVVEVLERLVERAVLLGLLRALGHLDRVPVPGSTSANLCGPTASARPVPGCARGRYSRPRRASARQRRPPSASAGAAQAP